MATLRFMRPGTHLNLILYMGGLKMQDLKIGDQKRWKTWKCRTWKWRSCIFSAPLYIADSENSQLVVIARRLFVWLAAREDCKKP